MAGSKTDKGWGWALWAVTRFTPVNPGREEDPTDAQNESEERSNLRCLLVRAGANRMTAEVGFPKKPRLGVTPQIR